MEYLAESIHFCSYMPVRKMQIKSAFFVSFLLPFFAKEEQCAVVSPITAHWSLTIWKNKSLSCLLKPLWVGAMEPHCHTAFIFAGHPNVLTLCYMLLSTGVSVEKIKWYGNLKVSEKWWKESIQACLTLQWNTGRFQKRILPLSERK